MQLDDWVLCRIYNKKGTIEKHYNVVDKNLDVPHIEEKKPEISSLGYNHVNFTKMQTPQPPPPLVAKTVNNSDYYYNFQTSSSSEYSMQPPRLNGNSSSSSGPTEFSLEKEVEVQSDPKWNTYNSGFDFELNNYMDTFADDPFAPQIQYNDYQDVFMYMQNPF